jgi:hypothetical protein
MTEVPWAFSEPAADETTAVPNLPTPEGRLLGAELARLTDIEEERLRERFPHAHRRCGDCALRAGTDPNGCAETLLDVVKALVEHVPFYCHKAVDDNGPKLLCAGYAILADTDVPLADMARAEQKQSPATGHEHETEEGR